MENTLKTLAMKGFPGNSVAEDCREIYNVYDKYRSTQEGKRVQSLLEHLNHMALDLCMLHGVNCCTKNYPPHFKFQCKHNSDPIISFYQEHKLLLLDFIGEVEQYVAYVAAHEIDYMINEISKTSYVANEMKGHNSIIPKLCIEIFSENAHVVCYKERTLAAMESTNILQEGEDTNMSKEEEIEEKISLGMPMHPKEEESDEEE